jgi:hypothetical protein
MIPPIAQPELSAISTTAARFTSSALVSGYRLLWNGSAIHNDDMQCLGMYNDEVAPLLKIPFCQKTPFCFSYPEFFKNRGRSVVHAYKSFLFPWL